MSVPLVPCGIAGHGGNFIHYPDDYNFDKEHLSLRQISRVLNESHAISFCKCGGRVSERIMWRADIPSTADYIEEYTVDDFVPDSSTLLDPEATLRSLYGDRSGLSDCVDVMFAMEPDIPGMLSRSPCVIEYSMMYGPAAGRWAFPPKGVRRLGGNACRIRAQVPVRFLSLLIRL